MRAGGGNSSAIGSARARIVVSGLSSAFVNTVFLTSASPSMRCCHFQLMPSFIKNYETGTARWRIQQKGP